MPETNINIIRDPENPEALEILAESIISIDAAIKKLMGTRVKRDVVIKLIQMNCTGPYKPTLGEIHTILDSIDTLKRSILIPEKKTGK